MFWYVMLVVFCRGLVRRICFGFRIGVGAIVVVDGFTRYYFEDNEFL